MYGITNNTIRTLVFRTPMKMGSKCDRKSNIVRIPDAMQDTGVLVSDRTLRYLLSLEKFRELVDSKLISVAHYESR